MSGEHASFDTSGFDRLISDLVYSVGGPGTNSDAAMRGEMSSLLKVCIDYTPQATQSKIRARAIYRFQDKYSVRGSGDLKLTYNTGDRGGNPDAVWLRSGGKFHIMVGPGRWPAQPDKFGKFSPGAHSRMAPGGAHWPDWLWAQYQALESQTPAERKRLQAEWIKKAQASRGLARLSWFQIAESLGLDLSGVRVKLEARGSDGRAYLNGSSRNLSTRDALHYELINKMPALVSGGLDGVGIANRALATRETAFAIAVGKGVFADIEQVAKRYPGLLAA